jgi:pyruvate formate lyase activating enzyme
MTGGRSTVDDVLEEVLRDSVFYDESGGGVTFSGGEPLIQAAFLKALLQGCRSHGLRTAVDTCGYAARETLLAVAELADLILYDLKFVDDARHIEYTGVSNALILSNLRALAAVHRNIWIRIPLIPGVNDTGEQLDALADVAASLPEVRQINLLPYHRTGVQKFKRLGEEYRLAHVQPPSTAQMEAAVARFRALGLDARSGG